jgi:hypothetical protein
VAAPGVPLTTGQMAETAQDTETHETPFRLPACRRGAGNGQRLLNH